jgi:hypothetical protein
MIETILIIYFSIAGICLFSTAFFIVHFEIEEIDGFWDWIVYNIFWIVQPIKSIIKLFKNM